VPTLSISVDIRFESPAVNIRREPSHDVVPDFVEGLAFGDALGIGLRCLSRTWWTVTSLSPSPELCEAVRKKHICRGPWDASLMLACRELSFLCSRILN
jgi:hypothetical protein